MRLEGRKALVTGGASGIGAATAARLAAEGADVVIGDLNVSGAEKLAAEIGASAAALDVTEPDSANALVAEHGPFSLLVNNAGTDEFGFFADTDPGQWQRVTAVNLFGVFACTHAVLPGMQQAKYGRIVSIASEAGRVGSKGSAVYSAAKGGVIAFMKVIAREGARFGVTANSIAPGPIETPLLMGALEFGEIGEKILETMKAGTQLRRLGKPEEVAAAVAFLVSDDASYVTGETLGVSGGLGVALEPGLSRSEEFTVSDRLVTDVGGTIGVRVLSTPGMIGMMERCSSILAYENLPDGRATVGFEVCVKHVAGAGEGAVCTVSST